MKRVTLWGLGLVMMAFITYLFFVQVSQATQGRTGGEGKRQGSGFDPTNVGRPGDRMQDDIHDGPGADRNQDRIPDGESDRVQDSGENNAGDCGTYVGPKEGDRRNCPASGNGLDGNGGGTGIPDRVGPDDGDPDGVPDGGMHQVTNRRGDQSRGRANSGDRVPDQVNSDSYLRAQGLTPVAGSEPGDSEPDRTKGDGVKDAVGVDGNGSGDGAGADRDQINQDGIPDGIQDRGNHRDKSRYGQRNASASVDFAFGPKDRKRDHAADKGGLSTVGGTGAGGGDDGGGCSYSTSGTADLGLMVAMFLPLMIAFGIKLARKSGK